MIRNEDYMKQRIQDLQREFESIRLECRCAKIKRQSFFKKLLRRFSAANENVLRKQGKSEPSLLKNEH